ncbi:unnamed protein product [Rotaria sp. Silwood2]|nr:unnamed protein product [Rotaria sp. Silwood2]CAF4094498.1 unnamed protein product [Rotaria sp. Silwood2]
MSRSNVNLLDLPDEILLIILKKLNNIDVLYSFIDVNNEHLNSVAQEKIFSDTLNFVSIDNVSAIDQEKLDRFCQDILPKIHENVKCFILEPISMEYILLAADYRNLTELQLFNFTQEVALNYFTNESSIRYIFQEKITNLIIANNDKRKWNGSLENYSRNVYEQILKFFKNLKYLSIIETFNPLYPPLSLCDLPSTIFFSSTLTHLCIKVHTLDDCIYLLDGRLKQLTTCIIRISDRSKSSSIVHNMDDLPNLKCFSLKCYPRINNYDEKILPLLHRMKYLETLTLYLHIKNRNRFIDNSHLQNEILLYMPCLHSFTFYISTSDDTNDLFRYVPSQDIQRIATNSGHEQCMANIIKYNSNRQAVCSIFSLPFLFDCLQDIGNIFPDTVFKYVTKLWIVDVMSFNHEFFIRISQSFPLLDKLHVTSSKLQLSYNMDAFSSDNSQSYSIVKYPHLTALHVMNANIDNIEEFLNETKAYVPCLTVLIINYKDLKLVTKNFTREETRRNCTKIKELMLNLLVQMKELYHYFPSL